MKKEKYFIITIIILSIILLVTITFICYDKLIAKNSNECPVCENSKNDCPACEENDKITIEGVPLNNSNSPLNYGLYLSTNNNNYNEYSLILTTIKDNQTSGFFSIALHSGMESDTTNGHFEIKNGKIKFSSNNENKKGSFLYLFGTTTEKLQYEGNYYYIEFNYLKDTITLPNTREFKLITG